MKDFGGSVPQNLNQQPSIGVLQRFFCHRSSSLLHQSTLVASTDRSTPTSSGK
jgi:hypothetical protein